MERGHASVQKLPDTSGVYFFMGNKKEVLYIGKATSLKDRVKSYFASNVSAVRGTHIVHMVLQAKRIEFRKTDSVLEALILETNLIKEFKPLYNTKEKDDKSFNHLVITMGEKYPRFLTVRGRELPSKLEEIEKVCYGARKKMQAPVVFGPFPHAQQFAEALKIIRKIFPFYDTKQVVEVLKEKGDHRLRFNESIGIYPAADITKQEYIKNVRHIRTIFEGKMKWVIRALKKEMQAEAKAERFERAGRIKKQLFALQHIEDVFLLKKETQDGTKKIRIEGYDVAHLGGADTVGVMVVVEDGVLQKSEYRTFSIKNATRGSDTGALKELLERRLAHIEWQYPRLIVLDGGVAQLSVAKKVFEDVGVHIPLVSVTKDVHDRPKMIRGITKLKEENERDILLANAEAHRFSLAVHKKKRSKHLVS